MGSESRDVEALGMIHGHRYLGVPDPGVRMGLILMVTVVNMAAASANTHTSVLQRTAFPKVRMCERTCLENLWSACIQKMGECVSKMFTLKQLVPV